MKTRSDRHPLIPVATTPEKFDACFASGEAFEASEELAAEMGFFPPLRTWSATKSFSHTPAPARQGSLKTTRLRGKCGRKNAVTDIPSVQHLASKEDIANEFKTLHRFLFGGLRPSLPRSWLSTGSCLSSLSGSLPSATWPG